MYFRTPKSFQNFSYCTYRGEKKCAMLRFGGMHSSVIYSRHFRDIIGKLGLSVAAMAFLHKLSINKLELAGQKNLDNSS